MTNVSADFQILKKNYEDPITILEGLEFSQPHRIKIVEFYGNNRYLNGNKDEFGRRKAFFQIINGMCDVEDAAVDTDTKDIQLTADDKDSYTVSELMTKDVYQWMKDSNFAQTLNEMKQTRTKYGGVLVKKCIKKDEDGKRVLEIEVPEWKNVITDQVDIIHNPIVETHYMTLTELQKKKSVWDAEVIKEIVEKAKKSAPGRRVIIHEMRGEFPRSYIKELEKKKATAKDEEFSYQLHIFDGGIEGKKTTKSTELKSLYWEDDTERVYKYLARKKKAGRALGIGVFEEGEEAQVMTNDAILKQNRAMEFTSKVIGQSASKNLKGLNMSVETDDGEVLEYEEGKPIEILQLLPSGGLGQFGNIMAQWYQQFERVTSSYSAQRGETPPSGTPFRLQATVLQQSSSVFQDLKEEFGIFLTEIFEDWVMPFLATQLNKEHVLAWNFTPDELQRIDKFYITREENRRKENMILDDLKIPTLEQQAQFTDDATNYIKQTGTMRFITMLKDDYKNASMRVTINVTGEQRNKAAVMESLNNIIMAYVKMPMLKDDPVLSQLFLKLIDLSGAGISTTALMTAIEGQKSKEVMPTDQTAPTAPLSLDANPLPNA